jgi:hypothetical protein
VFVAVFAVAEWVRGLFSPLACVVPTGERLSKLFENSLTGLRMQVPVSFVFLEFGFEFAVVGDLPVFVPSPVRILSGDVPQFRRGKPTLVEAVVHLLVVDDFRSIGAGCLQHRTVL